MSRTTNVEATRGRAQARATRPDVVYPPGYFTEPVRAWHQLRFESAMTVDKWGHMALLAGAERVRQQATGKGWGRGTIALPGTPDFGGQPADGR